MHTFVTLLNFTDQGIQNLKDSPHRDEMFLEVAEKAGACVKDMYWTLGHHDGVLIIEAPDDETAAAVVAPHLHVCENVVRLRPVPNANSGVPW